MTCLDCDKPVKQTSKRCQSCNMRRLVRQSLYYVHPKALKRARQQRATSLRAQALVKRLGL